METTVADVQVAVVADPEEECPEEAVAAWVVVVCLVVEVVEWEAEVVPVAEVRVAILQATGAVKPKRLPSNKNSYWSGIKIVWQ
jgi:hypothetical protein